MTRYRVTDPYQVHHDGRTYGPGEQLDAEPAVAAPWLAAGWVAEAAEDKPKRTRANG